MEIHMIGHASIFVKTADCAVLMDPVLWDTHLEGLSDICPRRAVIHDRLPPYDFLVVSHNHQDHFDLRTLAYLPKDVEVLIPKDPLIETTLRRLGYTRIHGLDDFSEISAGSTRICTTRSDNRVPEFGVVFADPSGVFWNQVDTVVSVDAGLLLFLHARFSRIDFLLATWQQMLEQNYQQNGPLTFPFEDYGRMLNNISLIRPRALAPGANGFKYVGEASWLNRVVFPITRERFCHDVGLACPTLAGNIFTLDPGDVLTLEDGRARYSSGAVDYVRTIKDDRDELDFQPVRIGADLVDHNPDREDLETLRKAVSREVECDLPAFINRKKFSFVEHRRWGVIYQLEVVFPDGPQQWFLDFSEEQVCARRGRNGLANFFTFITASSLYGLLMRTKGWDYAALGGYYRRYQKVYAVTPLGIIRPKTDALPDVLELRFPYKQLLQEFLQREAEKWRHFYSGRQTGPS
jgi:UDP-MurNAc hydroxylase